MKTGTIKLWVDDERPTPGGEGWCTARSYAEFCSYFYSYIGNLELVSLDHDLGQGKSGYDCAKEIVEFGFNTGIWPDEIRIHTANGVGRDNMIQLLERYAPEGTVTRG